MAEASSDIKDCSVAKPYQRAMLRSLAVRVHIARLDEVSGKQRPKNCYLNDLEAYKVVNGQKIWRDSTNSRFYTWDSLHGEIEVFDKRGHHLGALDAVSGPFDKICCAWKKN